VTRVFGAIVPRKNSETQLEERKDVLKREPILNTWKGPVKLQGFLSSVKKEACAPGVVEGSFGGKEGRETARPTWGKQVVGHCIAKNFWEF